MMKNILARSENGAWSTVGRPNHWNHSEGVPGQDLPGLQFHKILSHPVREHQNHQKTIAPITRFLTWKKILNSLDLSLIVVPI